MPDSNEYRAGTFTSILPLMVTPSPHFIDSLQSLKALFGELSPASTLKEIDYVHPVYQRIIAASRPIATLY